MTATRTHPGVFWQVSKHSLGRIRSILMQEGTPITEIAIANRRQGSGVMIVEDPYYILAPSSAADEHTRVLKHGDTFAVFDYFGDIKPGGLGEEGLYHEGTRFLSQLALQLLHERPLFLSSTVREDNAVLTVDLTNPDVYEHDRVIIPRGSVHIERSKFLWQATCYERITLQNYDLRPVKAGFSLEFAADFADIFEVRGAKRPRRGEILPPVLDGDTLILTYRGLDDVIRRTRIVFSPSPRILTHSTAVFHVTLPPQGKAVFDITTSCEIGERQPAIRAYEDASQAAAETSMRTRNHWSHIYTSNEQFNHWVNRSLSDVKMMISDTPRGPYPYAGVPWFSVPFGRDGIITALECLWVNPALAAGVLQFLASTQATELVPQQDAEPGKILHETRRGEMAALGEVPFGRYYGSVDSTPLFLLLAGAYYDRTGDRALIERIWPNLEAALRWIDDYGDADGDGFVEYARHSSTGLIQQGWKDSHDSVFHQDGTLPQAPIALCEVQAYVYGAWKAAARLAACLGDEDRARSFTERTRRLQERFEEAFWCEDLSTYALALDGDKRPCRVRTSNAGQCLFTGIARPDRARRVAQTLISPGFFSGWGIRTVASSEARYNPMSYHNGSIWPHDNALIAQGFAHYGLYDAANKVLGGLFDSSLFVDLQRMPELFCGFPRRAGEGPTLYPVACAPQAWAAGAVFMLLRATLGLTVTADPARVFFRHPRLPEFLGEIWIRDLAVGPGSVDCRIVRHQESVSVEVLRRTGDVEVMVLK
jgi:glycogen debranching enzyme